MRTEGRRQDSEAKEETLNLARNGESSCTLRTYGPTRTWSFHERCRVSEERTKGIIKGRRFSDHFCSKRRVQWYRPFGRFMCFSTSLGPKGLLDRVHTDTMVEEAQPSGYPWIERGHPCLSERDPSSSSPDWVRGGRGTLTPLN